MDNKQCLTSTATVVTNGTLSGGAAVYKLSSTVGRNKDESAKVGALNAPSAEEQNAIYNTGITNKGAESKNGNMMYIQDGS